MKSLASAIRKISPTRLAANQEIVITLLAEFQIKCLDLSVELLKAIQQLQGKDKNNVAIQSLFDIGFLRRFFETGKEKDWKTIEDGLLEIVSLLSSMLLLIYTNKISFTGKY